MLARCPLLESCTLAVYVGDNLDEIKKITLPALRCLRLRIHSVNMLRVPILFESLVAPNVRHLTLSGVFNNSAVQNSDCPFISITSQDDCQLERLTLSGIPMSPDAFIKYLSRTPGLVSLWIEKDSSLFPKLLLNETVSERTRSRAFVPVFGACLYTNLQAL